MMRLSILALCVAHSLAHVDTSYGNQASFGGGGKAFASGFNGDKLGGTSTLRTRGVIADPLSNNNFGKTNVAGVKGNSGFGGNKGSSGFGGNKGSSLIGNDNLFRKQQGIDSGFGSSNGIGGAFSSSKSVGSGKGLSGSSFGSVKGIGSSLGSDNLFGSSKGIGGDSFGYGSSFENGKSGGSSFGAGKDIGSSFGSSKVIGPSFGSHNDLPGSVNQGIGGNFGRSSSSLKGNHGFNAPYGADNSFAAGVGKGQSFSGGFGKGNNLISNGKGSSGSISGDYVNSFNQGYGIQGDNVFGKGSGSFGRDDIYGPSGISGGSNTGFGNKGGVNTVYGNDFQSGYGQGGFGKSNSVSSKGSSFSSGGLSKTGGVQDFKDFSDADGLGRVRGEYGIDGGNIVNGKGSFSKSGNSFNQGYNGDFSGTDASIRGGPGFSKGNGFNQFSGNNKGLNFGNQGLIGSSGKGFDGDLYSDSLRSGNSYGGQGVWTNGGNSGGFGSNGKGFDNELYSLSNGRGSAVSGGTYGDNAFRGKASLGNSVSSFNAGSKTGSFGGNRGGYDASPYF